MADDAVTPEQFLAWLREQVDDADAVREVVFTPKTVRGFPGGVHMRLTVYERTSSGRMRADPDHPGEALCTVRFVALKRLPS